MPPPKKFSFKNANHNVRNALFRNDGIYGSPTCSVLFLPDIKKYPSESK